VIGEIEAMAASELGSGLLVPMTSPQVSRTGVRTYGAKQRKKYKKKLKIEMKNV
jgi:hypothetical protein